MRELFNPDPPPELENPGQYQRQDPVWVHRLLKDGTQGKRRDYMFGPWYTVMQQCARCGVWGSPLKCRQRMRCYCPEIGFDHAVFCWDCVPAISAMCREFEANMELLMVTKKLRRTKREQ